MRPKQLALLCLLSLVAISSQAFVISAQPSTPTYRIAIQLDESLVIYSLDNAGTYTLLRDFGTDFGLLGFGSAGWSIPTAADIVPSLDGQKIAFIASDQLQVSLFIYDIREDSLTQELLSGYANLLWSPDSSALALIPSERFVELPPSIESLSIFDVLSAILTPITSATAVNEPVLWTLDNQNLLFVGDTIRCEIPCVNAQNWNAIARDGQTTTQLTDIGNQIGSETALSLFSCEPTIAQWSEAGTLIYALDCQNMDGNSRAFVYSLTLNGDNRRKFDSAAVFDDASAIVVSLFVSDHIYLALAGLRIEDDIYHNVWRILRITETDRAHTLYEETFNVDVSRVLNAVDVSPSGEKFALSGFDFYVGAEGSYLVIVDLTEATPPQKFSVTQHICAVDWLDDNQFIFTEYPEGVCGSYEPSGDQYLFDSETGMSELLATPSGSLWIIDIEIIGPPNVSPVTKPAATR